MALCLLRAKTSVDCIATVEALGANDVLRHLRGTPKPEKWDVYLENAQLLRPELVRVDGFVDNIRYRSLTREGWILSLSGWRDEKAVVRWRTAMGHHMVQERGRTEILLDYRLRVARLRRTRASLQVIRSRSNGWTKPKSGKERRSRS